MNEIEELIKTYEKDIANLTKSMGFSSPLNETRKRELLSCLEFGVSALRKVKREPVEVPYCFEVDYERHSHLKYNKSEMLLTAMGGIYRTAFQNQFKELHKDTFKTGIKWNGWSLETILWASRNYEAFSKAVITGEYAVAKEPLYIISKSLDTNEIFKNYFVGFAGGMEPLMDCRKKEAYKFSDFEKAKSVAFLICGNVEEEAE